MKSILSQSVLSLRIQRIIYGLICIVGATTYIQLGNPWYLLLPLMASIDITFFGYLAGSTVGAWAYNASHTFIVPLSLLIVWTFTNEWWLQFVGLIWITSIALARSWGFGLKYTKGYSYTQLGKLYKWQIPHPKSILTHIPKKQQWLVHVVLFIEIILLSALLVLLVL